MRPDDILATAAKAQQGSNARLLLVASAVAEILGIDVVVVGGVAQNLVTGSYRPTDIDLIAPVGAHERRQLVEAGFFWRGVGHRHVGYEMPDGEIVLVEFPSAHLDGIRTPAWVETAPGVGVFVIALDDLMMDRIRQATDGTSVTLEDALQLATAAFDRIDWESLEQEAGSPEGQSVGLPDMVRHVREAAERLRP